MLQPCRVTPWADSTVVTEQEGMFVAHYVEDGAILNVGAAPMRM